MSRDFSMHERRGWGDLALPGRPLWMRIYALAYAGHHRNRHTGFESGGLQRALEYADTTTGEVVTFTRQATHQAIRTAVEFGYLDAASNVTCLVVPEFISGGNIGQLHARCGRHG